MGPDLRRKKSQSRSELPKKTKVWGYGPTKKSYLPVVRPEEYIKPRRTGVGVAGVSTGEYLGLTSGEPKRGVKPVPSP